MQYKYPGKGAFTLTETETNKGVFTLTEAESEREGETDEKWVVWDCVDRDKYSDRCQWVSNPFYQSWSWSRSQSWSRSLSLSV